MKTLGMIGGMSWESSIEYYRLINEGVRARLGGLHSARLVIVSVDFDGFAEDQAAGRWDRVEAGLLEEAARLVKAGAEAILIGANTMHLFADRIEEESRLPVLHIADAVGGEIARSGARKIGLFGTRYTMEKDFYIKRLRERFDVEALVPPLSERERMNRIIFEELCRGIFLDESKEELLGIIEAMSSERIEGVALACTELPLVIKEGDLGLPIWDSLRLHAAQAVSFLVSGS